MIQGRLWVCPENMSTMAFRREIIDMVLNQAHEDGNEYSAVDARYTTPKEFNLIWRLQSSFSKDEATTEKYRKVAADGRLLYVEVEK